MPSQCPATPPSPPAARRARPCPRQPRVLGSEPSRPTPDTRICVRQPMPRCPDPPSLARGTRADWSVHRNPAKRCPGWRTGCRRCASSRRGRSFALHHDPACGAPRPAPRRARPVLQPRETRQTPPGFAGSPARKPPARLCGRSRSRRRAFAPRCVRWRIAKSFPPARPNASGARRWTADLNPGAASRRAAMPRSPSAKADPGQGTQ